MLRPMLTSIDTAFDVPNSGVFQLSPASKLQATLGTPTDSGVWTLSMWIKRTVISVGDQYIFSAISGTADGVKLENDKVNVVNSTGAGVSTVTLTDTSNFVHLVFAADTGAGDRFIVYVDGSSITISGSDATSWAKWNTALLHTIGAFGNSGLNSSQIMAELVHIDGQQLTPSSFADAGLPIDVSGLTFGDNGFYLDFQDSGDLGKDVSGEANHFTNTDVTQSSDTPTS